MATTTAAPDEPGLERKSFALELKELADDGSFVMYALVFGNVDRGGDVIEPGAVVNLDEFVRDGFIALNHRATDLPVGYPTAATQDARGLRVEGKFHSHPAAQECRAVARERLDAGKSVQASIGYLVVKASEATRDGKAVRSLEQIKVYESSFVNLAMNPRAGVVAAKSTPTPITPPEGTVPHQTATTDTPGTDAGILAGLKRLLGLETKKGAAISAANREKLRGVADAMDEHHKCGMEKCAELHKCVKAVKAHHEEGLKIAESLRDFADSHEPDVDDEDEPPKRPKKGKKDDDPQDTADGDPPKGLTREAIAIKLAALPRL